MARKTFRTGSMIALAALIAMGSFTVPASGDGEDGGGFLHQIHALVEHHLQHGGQHEADFLDQLNLTPDQAQRLEKIHEAFETYGSEGHSSMQELHNRLVAQVEQGHVDAGEIHSAIDAHLEQVRGVAYAVTDELVGLVNDLDAQQRETLLAHLQGGREGHGHQGH